MLQQVIIESPEKAIVNDLSVYFNEVYAAFQVAAAHRTMIHSYRIAGHTVNVHFAGPALVPLLTPAPATISCTSSSSEPTATAPASGHA